MDKSAEHEGLTSKYQEEIDKNAKHNENMAASEAFNEILKHVGMQGKYQWRVGFIASFCGLFLAMNNLAAAFLAAAPNFICRDPYGEMVRNFSSNIPPDFNSSTFWNRPKCKYYEVDFNLTAEAGDQNQEPLKDAAMKEHACHSWLYDDSVYKATIVTEWNLVCDKRWMMTSAQSTYMAGVLVGAIVLSELSDMYGRRTIALVSVIGALVSWIAISQSPSFLIFIALRFFSGFFGSGMFLPNFVLVMEFVNAGARTTMGMMYQGFFGVGFCLLPLVAYFIRDWRNLQLAISLPGLVLLAYFKILPESPRWLLSKGREEEALEILRKVAKVNSRSLPEKKELQELFSSINRHERHSGSVLGKIGNFFRNQVTLLRTPIMRRRCLIIYFSWFVVSLIYYGLTFSGNNISASVYLMVFMSGMVEIPAYIIACFTVKKFGRRLNMSFCFAFSGIACMLILGVPKDMVWVNLILASAGKFFNSIAFSIAYIYSAELFPTRVRNLAVGSSSMWARVGAILAPFIVDVLGTINYVIPSTVFGILSLIAAAVDLLLPETGNGKLPETVEEIEAMER